MPLWDLLFRVGGDTKPLRQDLERAGAHMDEAGRKIGKRFGLSWSSAIAGVAITAGAAITAALHRSMEQAVERARGASKLGINVEDFDALKSVSEATGVSMEILADALKRGGDDAARLRAEMEEANKGLIGASERATGFNLAWSKAISTGLQSFTNLVGMAGGVASNVIGAGAGVVAGIKSLFTGGGLSGAYEAFTDQIARGDTAGDTALANQRVMTAEAQILEKKKKRRDEEEKEKNRIKPVVKGEQSQVSADALAQVGILFNRFGANMDQQQWRDDMLTATREIAKNTSTSSNGPPGPITKS
jgi:hypothetical protein